MSDGVPRPGSEEGTIASAKPKLEGKVYNLVYFFVERLLQRGEVSQREGSTMMVSSYLSSSSTQPLHIGSPTAAGADAGTGVFCCLTCCLISTLLLACSKAGDFAAARAAVPGGQAYSPALGGKKWFLPSGRDSAQGGEGLCVDTEEG